MSVSCIFQSNVELINNHNSEAENGKHTHAIGVNQFADLTKEEWVDQLGLNFQNLINCFKILCLVLGTVVY